VTTPDGPASYRIETLLSQSVQPFRDLPPEEFDALVASLKAHGLQNPILLTEDQFLYDGHQRCKALLAIGRKRITKADVRVQRGVTRTNMLEHAYSSNVVRRQLSTADKAIAMHQCVARGWSQRKIARTFGVSQPAVSQLLAVEAYQPENMPDVIVTEGADGKTRTRVRRKKTTDPAPDVTARDEVPTSYDYRQRVKKELRTIATTVTHLSTDAQMCGGFATYAERDDIIAQITGIITALTGIADRITTTEGTTDGP
jgi:ParB-like chromosome segregation protein Spo0J